MKLNKNQEIVVNELEKNILLIASAGTGKTNTLSKRIENIINSKKASPDEVLCITFTNKAAKEMELRIDKTLKGIEKKVEVKTFHSFCFDLVKMKAKEDTDVFTDFIVFDENDTLELIKSFNNSLFSPINLQKFINIVKEETLKKGTSYEKAVESVFENKDDDINYICTIDKRIDFEMKNYLKKEAMNLISIYNNMLSINRALDFNDLVIIASNILSDKKTISYLRSKYKYINIDEVQDTSIFEYEIIEKIFGENNILICGDIFQTIYEWRGSDPLTIINKFKEKYSPININLNKNYRSTEILNKASKDYLTNAFSSNDEKVHIESIESSSNILGEKVVFKENESLYEEASFIYSEINKLSLEDIAKTCILTRNNQINVDLSRELNYISKGGQGFEFILVDQFKFFRKSEIKDILAFFKLIGNNHDSNSIRRIIKKFKVGIKSSDISLIDSSEVRESGVVLADFIDKKTQKGDYFKALINEYKNNNIIVFDVESTGVNVLEDEIIQIAAIKINSEGEVIEEFEKFIKPVKSVGDSFYIHGFSDKYLNENGEDKKLILESFINFISDSVIVGHNVKFDIDILTSELIRNNVKNSFENVFYDTLDIYRRYYKNLENYKLETLSRIFETQTKPSHDAMDDILATKDLLTKAIINNIIPTSLTREYYFTKYQTIFSKINGLLNKIFDFGYNNKPHDILAYIMKELNIKEYYKDENLERIRDFYILLKNLYENEVSYRDAIIDVLKLTSLSNGELEQIIIKRSNKIRVPIITVHQSKGLEFDTVFLSGLQDGKFPSYRAIKSNNIEEEKRTFYVGITRAKKRLYITYNKDAGYGRLALKSRLIDFIPSKYICIK